MALINNETISAPQVQASTRILGQNCVIDRSESERNWFQETQFNDFIFLLLLKREKCTTGLNSTFPLFLFSNGLYSRGRESTEVYNFGNTSADIGVHVQWCICSVNSDSSGHTCL